MFAETNHFCRNKGKNKTHAIEEKIQKTSSKALWEKEYNDKIKQNSKFERPPKYSKGKS